MPSPTTDNLAVLVDADNAQASVVAELLAEVARYGTATVKRAYGDWTTPNLLLRWVPIIPAPEIYDLLRDVKRSQVDVDAQVTEASHSLVRVPVGAAQFRR